MDKFRHLSVGLGAFRRAARYCSTRIDYGGERAEHANFKELVKQIEEESSKCDDLKKKLAEKKLAAKKLAEKKLAEKSGMAKQKC